MDKKCFGAYIRYHRLMQGKSQKDFSQEIGTSMTAVRDWEKGRTYPQERFLMTISKAINRPFAEVLNKRFSTDFGGYDV